MTTTAAPTGIMGRLKAETAEQHAIAEAKPLEAALVAGSIDHDQYKQYLGQRWLIHRELEAATDRVLSEDHRLSQLGLPGLYQTANIEADLGYLGVETSTIEPLKGAQNLVETIQQAPSPAVLMARASADTLNPLPLDTKRTSWPDCTTGLLRSVSKRRGVPGGSDTLALRPITWLTSVAIPAGNIVKSPLRMVSWLASIGWPCTSGAALAT